jgi:hypothetical protein
VPTSWVYNWFHKKLDPVGEVQPTALVTYGVTEELANICTKGIFQSGPRKGEKAGMVMKPWRQVRESGKAPELGSKLLVWQQECAVMDSDLQKVWLRTQMEKTAGRPCIIVQDMAKHHWEKSMKEMYAKQNCVSTPISRSVTSAIQPQDTHWTSGAKHNVDLTKATRALAKIEANEPKVFGCEDFYHFGIAFHDDMVRKNEEKASVMLACRQNGLLSLKPVWHKSTKSWELVHSVICTHVK